MNLQIQMSKSPPRPLATLAGLAAFAVTTAIAAAALSSGAHALDIRPGIYVGAEVINENGTRGSIRGIYGDGTVAVLYNGYSSTNRKNVESLAITRGCNANYCVGDRVINENGTRGVLQGLYQDDTFAVLYDGYSSTNRKAQANLAVTQGCYSGFCVTDKVINENGTRGSVQAIYTDGTLAILYEGYSSTNRKNITSLAYTAGCIQQFCVGAKVINENGTPGTIQGIYTDGTVALLYNGYSSTNRKNIASLALTAPAPGYNPGPGHGGYPGNGPGYGPGPGNGPGYGPGPGNGPGYGPGPGNEPGHGGYPGNGPGYGPGHGNNGPGHGGYPGNGPGYGPGPGNGPGYGPGPGNGPRPRPQPPFVPAPPQPQPPYQPGPGPRPRPLPGQAYQWVTPLERSDVFSDLSQDTEYRRQAVERCLQASRQTGQSAELCRQISRIQLGR